MIITVASQKGGVGKTTLTLLLANYLTSNKNNVHVIDFDIQNTALYFYKKEIMNEEDDFETPYVVESAFKKIEEERVEEEPKTNNSDEDEDNVENILNDENFLKDLSAAPSIILIDTAGKLSEDYGKVLLYSDYIIIPFDYTEHVLHSTHTFAEMCSEFKDKKNIIFVPNKVFLPRRENREKVYNLFNEVNIILSEFGTVLKSIIFNQRNMERISVIKNTSWHDKNVRETFEEINNIILRNNG